MLKVGILDANIGGRKIDDNRYIDGVVSYVGQWLKWELAQAGMTPSAPGEADIVLLVHAGGLDWLQHCRGALRAHRIEIDPARRKGKPYVITGGSVDASPFTALQVADALAVGEAYLFVRQLLDMVKAGATVEEIAAWAVEYPHALERRQIIDCAEDAERPWLLRARAPRLATPDDYVDWEGTPSVRTREGLVYAIAAKGCHLKCTFCATTYRQTYRFDPNAARIQNRIAQASGEHADVAFITNDAAALPYYWLLAQQGIARFQSVTVKALRNPEILDKIARSKMKTIRFGVEGVSERIRQAFGKPVANEEIVHILRKFAEHKILVSHLFFIVGAPYEQEDDWIGFQRLLVDITRHIQRGIVRIKMSPYTCAPPAPLCRFTYQPQYAERIERLKNYLRKNWHSPHVKLYPGLCGAQLMARRNAELLSIAPQQAMALVTAGHTQDLAPTLEDAHRMKHEIIAWPLECERRWRLGGSYQKRMGVEG